MEKDILKSKLIEKNICPGDTLEVIINKWSHYQFNPRNYNVLPSYEHTDKTVHEPEFKILGYYINYDGSSLILANCLSIKDGIKYPIHLYSVGEKCIFDFNKL